MKKFKKVLKHYLPDPILRFLRRSHGLLQHHGLILLLFPFLTRVFRSLPDSVLRFLMRKKILTYDFVMNYAIPRKMRMKIMNSYDKDTFYLNVGAGLFMNRKNWRILEFSGDPILGIGYRYHPELIDHDIDLMQLKSWNIPDNKADLVYTSHCFEHLSNEAVKVAFREIFRIMKTDAVFRITLPNIDLAYNAYLKGDLVFFTLKKKFSKQTIESHFLDFFSPIKPEEINIEEFKKDALGEDKEVFLNKYINKKDYKHNYHKHINWFDFNKIKRFALMAGFKEENIILAAPKQSISPEMRAEEFDIVQVHWSLYVDIIKN